jgi:hypothetical protein
VRKRAENQLGTNGNKKQKKRRKKDKQKAPQGDEARELLLKPTKRKEKRWW